MDTIAPNRKAAIATGAPLYQGGQCKRGHPGIRYVGNKACRDCAIIDSHLKRALFSPEELERERKRKRDAKRAGRWQREDPAKHTARGQLRRSIVQEGIATPDDIEAIGRAQGWRCAYCGTSDKLQIDHKIATTRQGRHDPDNLQFLCARHNRSKHVTPDAEYRQRHGIPAITPWDAGGAAIWRAALMVA